MVYAEYRDTDGVEDIKAGYVWFTKTISGIKDFTTPTRIADISENLDPKSENTSNWGFMITRSDAGEWDKVYTPYIDDDEAAWVLTGEKGARSFP